MSFQVGQVKISKKAAVTHYYQRRKGRRIRYQRWTQDQNIRYGMFLHRHQVQFESETNRRVFKVFLRLAQFVQSKTVAQCKSHHQKMMLRLGNLHEVIDFCIPSARLVERDRTWNGVKMENMEDVGDMRTRACYSLDMNKGFDYSRVGILDQVKQEAVVNEENIIKLKIQQNQLLLMRTL